MAACPCQPTSWSQPSTLPLVVGAQPVLEALRWASGGGCHAGLGWDVWAGLALMGTAWPVSASVSATT